MRAGWRRTRCATCACRAPSRTRARTRERALIEKGLRYLRLRWKSDDWRVYEVLLPAPIVIPTRAREHPAGAARLRRGAAGRQAAGRGARARAVDAVLVRGRGLRRARGRVDPRDRTPSAASCGCRRASPPSASWSTAAAATTVERGFRCARARRPAPAAALPALRRGARARGRERALRGGHSFDVARQGYLSLLAGDRRHAGDTAEMVAARERFLGGRSLRPARRDAVADALRRGRPAASSISVPAPAGTSPALLERLPAATGLALDVSKPALRRAARAHPRLAAVACDAWGPLPAARRRGRCGARHLRPAQRGRDRARAAPGGLAVVVTPAARTTWPSSAPRSRSAERKQERPASSSSSRASRSSGRRELEWALSLDRAGARDAVAMGPSAFHSRPAELDERVAALPQPVEATAAVAMTLATATTG